MLRRRKGLKKIILSMANSPKLLLELRQKLALLKFKLDEDVPNHSYDSANAIAAKAGGVEEAIKMVDEQLASLDERKKNKYKIDDIDIKLKKGKL